MGTIADTKARAQRVIWNDLVGEAWVRHQTLHDRQAAPFGEAVMRALGPVQGASVLDVGCGTGATTADLATNGARDVVGVDLSQPMITAARASNHRSNVTLELGDILDFDRFGSFDVIFSRFGVMFFTDPASAFAHLKALGRPGARLGFCCWGPPADNPWMALPVLATVPILGPPTLAGPGEPGPFSLSNPEVIGDALGHAGWTDIQVEPLALDLPHPAGDARSVASVVIEFSPPIVEGLQKQPERAEEARDAIAAALHPLERDGVVHLRMSALIVDAHA